METPKVLAATIDEAKKQGVPFHRSISVVRGASMLTREQLKEFAQIAHDNQVEVIITPGPRPMWYIGRQIATPEGAISGLRMRGMDSIRHYLMDIQRCIEIEWRLSRGRRFQGLHIRRTRQCHWREAGGVPRGRQLQPGG